MYNYNVILILKLFIGLFELIKGNFNINYFRKSIISEVIYFCMLLFFGKVLILLFLEMFILKMKE